MGDMQLQLVSYKKGAYIIVEDDKKNDVFFIVRTGSVKVFKEFSVADETRIAQPGDFFGVVATMSSHTQIETAQAHTDVTLIVVKREHFKFLIQKNTPIAIKIIKQFSQRMRHLDESLTKISLKGQSTGEDPSHLFNVGEYYIKQSQYNLAFHAFYRFLQYNPNSSNVDSVKDRMIKIKPYVDKIHLKNDNSLYRTYPKGTMIFSECEPGNEMFIIQEGTVKITKIIQNKEVMLAMLKAGDIFGEMALLENKPRSASAIATSDVKMMSVNRSNFEKMVTTQPDLVVRLTQMLSERIWFIYKQLENALLTNPLGKLYDNLLITLFKNKVAIDRAAYEFDFGSDELLDMTGLKSVEGTGAIKDLLRDPNVKIVNNHIMVKNILDLEKQAKYYRKMQRIEIQRRQSALKNSSF